MIPNRSGVVEGDQIPFVFVTEGVGASPAGPFLAAAATPGVKCLLACQFGRASLPDTVVRELQ